MTLGLAAYGFGFVAGVVSTLSPCVLPLVPILLGSATSSHPRGPWAIATGLALSYAVVGTTLAWLGGTFGIDGAIFKITGALLLGLLGGVLISGQFQQRFSLAASGLGNTGNRLMASVNPDGLAGQFLIGALLGLVWSPCVGPTLGAAIVLASQGTELPQVALMMGLFGLGAALPLLVIATLSRKAFMAHRDRWLAWGKAGKLIMGLLMVAVSLMLLTGLDKVLEAWVVEQSPQWLTNLTTRF